MKLGDTAYVAIDTSGHIASCPEGMIIGPTEESVKEEIGTWRFMLKQEYKIVQIVIQEPEWDESW